MRDPVPSNQSAKAAHFPVPPATALPLVQDVSENLIPERTFSDQPAHLNMLNICFRRYDKNKYVISLTATGAGNRPSPLNPHQHCDKKLFA
jgi:hypothetical protein